MSDMQVIEALYLKDKEPHDYLHIKYERTPSRLQPIPAPGWRIQRKDRSEPLGADRFRQRNHRKTTSVS
jgi:hypothetical protein